MAETCGRDGPDAHGAGLVVGRLDPLRYSGQSDDPTEVPGMLRALMPELVRVLDVGCGTGSVTAVANGGKGNDVLAIEPDADRSAVARERGIEVFCGFLDEEFIARKGPFDVIVFSDVLEHLPSPDAMLKLAISGLRPGGIILASVPNVAHWSVRLNLLFGRFNYTETGLCDATHLRWLRAPFKGFSQARALNFLLCITALELFFPCINHGISKYFQSDPAKNDTPDDENLSESVRVPIRHQGAQDALS